LRFQYSFRLFQRQLLHMKTIILVFFAFLSLDLYCQTIKSDVLSSSGGSGTNEKNSMIWTLGETFINEYSNESFVISQGFHQSFKYIPTSAAVNINSVDIIAFPNPVIDLLSVVVNIDHTTIPWEVEIFDARGILMTNWKSLKTRFEIDFSSFENGTYLVRISQKNISSVFHIIKNGSSHEKN
jgi:hypothetical protein